MSLLSLNVNDLLGDKILKIINNFNPSISVPKNYRNMRNRINDKLNNLFPINVISIQYPKEWQMDKWSFRKQLQPINIFF